MNLLIVLITHDRLAYTKRTLRDLWDTIQVPYHLIVVDNASTDGTQEYLSGLLERNRIDSMILNETKHWLNLAEIIISKNISNPLIIEL